MTAEGGGGEYFAFVDSFAQWNKILSFDCISKVVSLCTLSTRRSYLVIQM